MAAEALAERLRTMNVIRTVAAWLCRPAGAGAGRVSPAARRKVFAAFDRSRIVLEPGPFVRAYLDAMRRGTRAVRLPAAGA